MWILLIFVIAIGVLLWLDKPVINDTEEFETRFSEYIKNKQLKQKKDENN